MNDVSYIITSWWLLHGVKVWRHAGRSEDIFGELTLSFHIDGFWESFTLGGQPFTKILAAVTFSDGIMCFVTINLQATIFLRNQKAIVLHL